MIHQSTAIDFEHVDTRVNCQWQQLQVNHIPVSKVKSTMDPN